MSGNHATDAQYHGATDHAVPEQMTRVFVENLSSNLLSSL